MIETALAFAPQTQAREDGAQGGYGRWRQSMAAVDDRHAAMRYDMNNRTAGPLPSFGNFLEKSTALATQSYAPQGNVRQDWAKPDLSYEAVEATKNADGAYTFGDVVDAVNPLHHIPLVGTLYRSLSGDNISPMSQILGGALFGGPIGAVAGTINAVMRGTTGRDMGERVLAFGGVEAVKAPNEKIGQVPPSLSLSSARSSEPASIPTALRGEEVSPNSLLVKANQSYARTAQSGSVSESSTGRQNFGVMQAAVRNRWNA